MTRITTNPFILDQRASITVSISQEAFDALPEVTSADAASQRERYRILLGSYLRINHLDIKITVDAVVEFPNLPQLYKEGTNRITVNSSQIRKEVAKLQSAFPEYQDLEIVGDFHTHPYNQEELLRNPELIPWNPSFADVECMIEDYRAGYMSRYPLIYGIGGKMLSGETGYKFYHLIHTGQGFTTKKVVWLT